MRTTLIINDKLLATAMELTKIKGKTALVRAGLEALTAPKVQERLISLGGKDKKSKAPTRRRAS